MEATESTRSRHLYLGRAGAATSAVRALRAPNLGAQVGELRIKGATSPHPESRV